MLTAFVSIAMAVVFMLVLVVVRQQALERRFAEVEQSIKLVASEWSASRSIVEEAEDFPTMSITVFDKSGHLLATNAKIALPDVSGRAKFRQFIVVGVQGGGDTVVGATSWIETEKGLRQLALVLAVLWLPLSLLTCAVTWYGGGLVLKPVTELVASANLLSGETDGGVLTTSDRAEFATLAASLNDLIGRVRHAGKLQEQFAADAAHELRNPLALLRTRIETTLLNPRRPVEYEEVLRSMLQSVEHMSTLVNALLLSARKTSSRAAPIDLALSVNEIISDWVVAGGWNRSQLELQLQPCFARISTQELEIVLRNILDNAARVSPADGVLGIQLGRSGELVELSVRDFGPGLSSSEKLEVFERFYRSDSARRRESGGTGIGLAVVKRIVENLGGTVRFIDIEAGAKIVVSLPAIDVPD